MTSLQLFLINLTSSQAGAGSDKVEMPDIFPKIIEEVLMDFSSFTFNANSSIMRSHYSISRRSIVSGESGNLTFRLLLVQVVTLILMQSPDLAKLVNFEDLIGLV